MSDLSNITVTPTEDGMISLLIDGQPLSEKYGMKFDPSIADDLKALAAGQSLKLFEQFVFSHADLNFEHAYSYAVGIIKEAEGYKQSKILHAEREAEAIRLVNEAADKYFVGNAQLLRKLEAMETSLSNNAKIVIPSGSELVNIIGEMAGGILPVERKHKEK